MCGNFRYCGLVINFISPLGVCKRLKITLMDDPEDKYTRANVCTFL